MRVSPVTEEMFEPFHQEHFFATFESFEEFIDAQDPLESFEVKKRRIPWKGTQRECLTCETTFMAKHPAQMYCDECREKERHEREEAMKRLSESEYDYISPTGFIAREKACVDCGSIFVATAPNMKKCEECSPKGGKLVKTA